MELLHEGNALFVDEAYAEAADAYSRALERAADAKSSATVADAHAKRAAAYLKLRKLSDALADADTAIQIDSTLEMAHLRKGYVYMCCSDGGADAVSGLVLIVRRFWMCDGICVCQHCAFRVGAVWRREEGVRSGQKRREEGK